MINASISAGVARRALWVRNGLLVLSLPLDWVNRGSVELFARSSVYDARLRRQTRRPHELPSREVKCAMVARPVPFVSLPTERYRKTYV